ncbi:Coenzyme F420 hydrogenase/dehydrogenase, beta subunit C-terminal domain [uncultured Duncaniella sp.]|uniref:Coenzyme F420 hydrogenase/dehydrogenase, beta subunit C-terminal domain n=1 Tax=uncultured Duncaniella sp. TaxID=2768039 RepID=UPI0025A9A760|nr:Coenzyme F420 hydrogenase/dehydrogenase, beta subunit C-terminal domain [uncultured Duncaniella sp.]
MINLPHEKCYGCQGCLNVCPKDAISMNEDECGYKYPSVDYNKCIRCGLCIKVCPELNSYDLNTPINVYAVVSKDKSVIQTTASGGFSSVLVNHIISHGGVVYGCSENNFEDIGHIRIDKINALNKIKNSKYVHSDIRLAYREAKYDLDNGINVLFTGTPCQISGLLCFLRRPYDNLLTMDLVCHGVPPMKMLREQVLSYPEIKDVPYGDVFVDFRWKEEIRSGCFRIHFGLRTVIRSGEHMREVRKENDIVNSYMRCFQTGISLRENCLRCPYARKERVSDITAADFWGLGRDIDSDMLDLDGVSLILVNTTKGTHYFNEVRDAFNVQERTFEEAKLHNRCLSQPFERLKTRDKFLNICRGKGLITAAKATDPVHRFESNVIIQYLRKYRISNFVVRCLSKGLRLLHIL